MKIENVNEFNINKLKDFLLSVKTINQIDDNVLKNAIVILDETDVVGAVSYEKFSSSGLIRYFVFKRSLENDVVISLFNKLESVAQEDNIKMLYCVVNSDIVEELFKELGFEHSNIKKLYIDEELFDMINNEKAYIMIKKIEKH